MKKVALTNEPVQLIPWFIQVILSRLGYNITVGLGQDGEMRLSTEVAHQLRLHELDLHIESVEVLEFPIHENDSDGT